MFNTPVTTLPPHVQPDAEGNTVKYSEIKMLVSAVLTCYLKEKHEFLTMLICGGLHRFICFILSYLI